VGQEMLDSCDFQDIYNEVKAIELTTRLERYIRTRTLYPRGRYKIVTQIGNHGSHVPPYTRH